MVLVPGKKCSPTVSRIVPMPSSSGVPFSRNRLTTSIMRRRSPSSWSSQPNVDAVKAKLSSARNPETPMRFAELHPVRIVRHRHALGPPSQRPETPKDKAL